MNLLDHLQYFEGDEIIIGGDFNLVLDVEIDKKNVACPKHITTRIKTIYAIYDNLELVDA